MPVEQIAPELERIVSLDQEVEWLGSGFGADGSALGVPWWPAEGPVWWKEGGYLLFSDIGQNRRMKWAPGEGVSVFLESTNEANGLTRDPQGRLIACEHAAQRVTRLEPDGKITVVADHYNGKRLNRPNDVAVKSDGSIYFTDPFRPTYPNLELGFAGVYRVSPDLSSVTLLAQDFVGPNGLCFSPGESILYVNDSRVGYIRAYDVMRTVQ
jgi:gluconolactonase